MLFSLHIRNVAVIEDLRMDVGEGFTILTGETGAGKSIVIDSLGLVLGDRADSTIIRDGADKAVVEAEFGRLNPMIFEPVFRQSEIEWQEVLLLRREVSARGSRCFVNDSPVTVATLKRIGDLLVDVHGQHDHQALLKSEHHREVLDGFSNDEKTHANYQQAFKEFRETVDAWQEARDRRLRMAERTLILNHEIQVIDAVNPEPGEDDKIETELRIAEQGERLLTGLHAVLADLYGDDRSAMDLMTQGSRTLKDLGTLMPKLAIASEQLEELESQLSDVVRELRAEVDGIDISPERCEELRLRSADLNRLKRGFQASLKDILQKREDLYRERDQLAHVDEDLEHLEAQLPSRRASASQAASVLSQVRQNAADRLVTALSREMANLGIPRARFAVHMDRTPHDRSDEFFLEDKDGARTADATGWDQIELWFSANPGEDLKPLARIISGGEASRVMLALKSVLAERDAIPVLLFDEIDTGVSGPIAHKVGLAMKALAAHHQIIAITHLPQIAAQASAHLVVEKKVRSGRTYTSVRALAMQERIRETARLMSGDDITDAALRNAEQLLQRG